MPLTGSRLALDVDRGVQAGCRHGRPSRSRVLAIAVVSAAVVVRSEPLDVLIDDPAEYGQDWQLRVGSGDGDGSTIGEQLAADPRMEAVDIVAQGGLDVVDAERPRTDRDARDAEIGGATSLGILDGT